MANATTTNSATADAIAAQIIDCYLPYFQHLRIRLFGSRAMGREQPGSDLDLYLKAPVKPGV